MRIKVNMLKILWFIRDLSTMHNSFISYQCFKTDKMYFYSKYYM